MASHRKCRPHHEDGPARERKDRKGGKGVHAGVRERVHLLHHQRSLGEVPAGEAQDGQRRGHTLRHDVPGLRELLGSAQNLPVAVPRDPPRKSEQAYRPIRCPWVQRQRVRRRESPAACSDRRPRHGRGRLHGLWIQRPQRERHRRLLGRHEPCHGRAVQPCAEDMLRRVWREEHQARAAVKRERNVFRLGKSVGDVRVLGGTLNLETGGDLNLETGMDSPSVGPHAQGSAKRRSTASLALAWVSHLDRHAPSQIIGLELLDAHAGSMIAVRCGCT